LRGEGWLQPSSSVQKSVAPSPLDRILYEQREAAATLPAAGGVLGVSDWVAEEVLLLADERASAGNARRRIHDREGQQPKARAAQASTPIAPVADEPATPLRPTVLS
jgi:hypothetical protein